MGRWVDITYITRVTDLECAATWIFTYVTCVYTCETPTQINVESLSSAPEAFSCTLPENTLALGRGSCYILFCLFLTFTEMESHHKHLYVWLLRFLLVAVCSSSFFFIAIQRIFNSFIHSPIEGPLGYFQFGGITNKTTMNALAHVFW